MQKGPPPRIVLPYFIKDYRSGSGFEIYLDSEVLPEQENRVWWRTIGTFEIRAFPEMQVENVGHDTVMLVPDVDLCSGYLDVDRHTIESHLVPVDTCACCKCWVTEYNQTPLLSNLRDGNNGKITSQPIVFIDANRRTFYRKYRLEVQQLSVSPSVYDFWNRVRMQKTASSDLFQTTPASTGTNITASDGQVVYGYFAAAAMKTSSIVINRSDVPFNVGITDTLKMDCRQAYKFSSNQKPPFW
jgi:hypothetical protein